jgi:hypothetical protein
VLAILGGKVLKLLTANGHDMLLVWVLEANASAGSFCEAMGGLVDAKKKFEVEDVGLKELPYRCSAVPVIDLEPQH